MTTDGFNFDESVNKPEPKLNRKWLRINGKRYRRSHYNYCLANDLERIPEGFVVHHKDGDKINDKIDNLEMLSWSEHSILHNKLQI